MKFLKWFGITILSFVALFLTIAAFLPSDFYIQRSTTVERHVDIVFQTAIDMNKRAQWDPFLEMEPEADIILHIGSEVVGSGYSWKGETIGQGRITIEEFIPNQLIKSKIEFIKPQSMESDVIWSFKELNGDTEISWGFTGTLAYPFEKWMGLFLDRSLGVQFEKGLSNFKKLVEKLPDLTGRTGEISLTTFEGLKALSIKDQCAYSKVVNNMITNYSMLRRHFRSNKIEISGHPFTMYHTVDDEQSVVQFEFGFPVKEKHKGNNMIHYIEIPKTKAVMASHFGHFKTVPTTHAAILKYLKKHNLKQSGPHWELYITDPLREPNQTKWETHVYFPIK